MGLNRDTIKARFEIVNDELKAQNISVECILIGGAAGIFLSENVRPTMDIDVFLKNQVTNKEVNEIFDENFIEAVTVASVPDPEEMTISDRLTWSNLIVYIPDFYSLAITKLFTDRKKDEEDLLSYILPGISDFHKLDELIRESRIDYVGNINNPFLNVNRLDDYKKELNIK